jgi:glycine oxidase
VRKEFLKFGLGSWVLESPSQFVRVVQPIETKWRIWLRVVVDLFPSRPLIFNAQVRPALADNLPALQFDREQKVLHINGLYRHGFLLTPTMVEEVLSPAVQRTLALSECDGTVAVSGSVNNSCEM